jgi:RNA polymerase sigma-70 factor (ECF subfamily)
MPVNPTTPSDEFVLLITNVQASLYAYVFSLLGDPHQAADVLQETNLVLWRKSSEFLPGTDFAAWARRVAHFQVMAFRKKLGREHLFFDDAIVADLTMRNGERGGRFDNRLVALSDCMKKLSERQRGLIGSHYAEARSIQEIATARNETAGAVAQALFRARMSLLKCIEQNANAEEKEAC